MDFLEFPKSIDISSKSNKLLSEVLKLSEEREKAKQLVGFGIKREHDEALPVDLNAEGAESFQTLDAKSLAIHINNYSSILSIIEHYWRETNGLRIFELGCGSGLLSKALFSLLGDNTALICSDYNKELVEFAQKSYGDKPHIDFRVLDVLAIPPELLNCINAVFFCELWEHLTEKEATHVLKDLYEHLPQGALVIFSTPDLTPFKRDKTHYYAHKREYTFKSLNDFLNDQSNNPFTRGAIYRILNKNLTQDLTFVTDNFGYYMNFVYKNMRKVFMRNGALKKAHNDFVISFYKLLKYFRSTDLEIKIKERYNASLLVHSPSMRDAAEVVSFSLITVLQK